MPAIALPLPPGETPSIEGEADGLLGWLVPPNHPSMQTRLGQETLQRQDSAIQAWRGERYKQREGWVQAWRYLVTVPGSLVPIGVANIVVLRQAGKSSARVANIVVAPEHRRQGWAQRLVKEAQRDFPRLCVDAHFTVMGAALFGIQPVPAEATVRSPKM